jgi:hypothetical protein
MPLVDFDDPAVWDSLYRCWSPDGTTLLHFERGAKERILGNDHWLLRDALNLQPGQSIGLIGAGYGWVAEDWAADGLGPIVAVDTSTYIQSNKTLHATVTILDEDGTSNPSRGRIRQALGLSGNRKADWGITEDILPGMTDAECLTLAGHMRNLATTVVHWVSALKARNQDPRLNWKTLEDWKALMTPDLVVQRGTNRVL